MTGTNTLYRIVNFARCGGLKTRTSCPTVITSRGDYNLFLGNTSHHPGQKYEPVPLSIQECELFEKPTSDRAKPVVDWTLERVANLLVTSYCKNRERRGMLSVVGTI